MIRGKLIELLKEFSEEEFRKFGLYVHSPFFNRETVQNKFYIILKKYYPLFNGRDFNKEKVFKKLYPAKKYSDGVMRNILSNMLTLAENFLAVNKFMQNQVELNITLLGRLTDKKQFLLFRKAEKLLDKLLDRTESKDYDYYYNKFRLELKKYNNNKKQKSSLVSPEGILAKAADYQATAYITGLLTTDMHISNTNRSMFSYNFNPALIKRIADYIESDKDKLTAVPYINYLYNTHKLVSTGEEKYFYALKNIFHHKYTSLGENDKRNLFSLLGNYCYVKTNTGELKFVNEQFVIIKTSIEHGYYKIGEGFISHLMFMNTVITGLEAGETGWVKNFIEKYKIELDHINRENTYIFCKALIYYWEKDYNKALDYAAKIKTGDTSYKHQIKSLYLKIYFDLPDTESFYLHIDSYKHFISADSNISKQVNTALGNYINYAKKIFDLKMKPNTEDADIELLKREIIKNKAMVNKPWLLRKIEELFKSPDQYSRKAVIPSG